MKITTVVTVTSALALAAAGGIVMHRVTTRPAPVDPPAVLVGTGEALAASRVATPGAGASAPRADATRDVPAEPTAAPDTGAFDIPREVPPTQLVSCEEFWELQGPIFAALPHMRRDDATKLGYFCPADFDKNDSVDPDDVALFVAAWRDASHPLSAWTDLNADGTIDLNDLDAFLLNYQQGGCDPVEARNYRDVIC